MKTADKGGKSLSRMAAVMRPIRVLLMVLLAGVLAGAAYLSVRGFDWLNAPTAARVRSVPGGDQEIAFLVPAATGDGWERLVAALDSLQRNWERACFYRADRRRS
jgi:hypothetical protein